MDNRELKLIFQRRRDKAKHDQEERRLEIYEAIPKIKSIDQQIRKLGLNIAMAAIKKPDQAELEMKAIEEEIKMLKQDKLIALTEHNIPLNYLDIHYACEKCEDTGFIGSDQCTCYKKELIKTSYEHSNITDVLDRENFDTFDFNVFSNEYDESYKKSPKQHMADVHETCLHFVENFKMSNQQNMVFYGQTGLGKTFLCNCIAKSLLDDGYTVLYQTAFRIIDIISQYRFSNPKSDEMRFKYNMLLKCDLLIIDDLGTEMINSFTTTEIFNIINTRLLEDRKTIISTNFELNQLTENYSERITSRLFGHYDFIPFFGKDLRWQ